MDLPLQWNTILIANSLQGFSVGFFFFFLVFLCVCLCSNSWSLLVKKKKKKVLLSRYLVRSVANKWLNDYTKFISLKRAGVFSIPQTLCSSNAVRKYLPKKNPTNRVRWYTIATSVWECEGTCMYLTKCLALGKKGNKIKWSKKAAFPTYEY